MTVYEEPGERDRITVSLPPGSRRRLKALVESGRAPDVSAIVEEALGPYLSSEAERAATLQRIDDLRGGRPFAPEALAWARKALGVEQSTQGAGAA